MERKCEDCKQLFNENDLHYSHNVPKYVFEGNDNERKNKADKYGTHLLCKRCHDIYEKIIFSIMIKVLNPEQRENSIKRAVEFSTRYFTGIGNVGVENGRN